MGVPTIAGQTSFDNSYNGNILVNAMTLGLVKKDKIFYSKATGLNNTDIIRSVTRDFGFPEKFNKRIARHMIIKNKFIPTVRPLRKNLLKLKRAVEQRTGNKVNLFKVQKELNQIYKSYFGAQFSVADDLIITEEKD